MLTFLAGPVIPSLSENGVKLGLEYRLIPLGSTPAYGIHFVDIIARVAMMFGGVTPGDAHRLLAYAAERAKAIVIVFPGLSDDEIALVDGMRVLGFPILSIGDYSGGAWIPAEADEVVRKGMEEKGIRVNVTAIPIPMGCSPAFEGKSIRKEEMYVEFGGGRSTAFELLRMRPADEVKDGHGHGHRAGDRFDEGGVGKPPRHHHRCCRKNDEEGLRAGPGAEDPQFCQLRGRLLACCPAGPHLGPALEGSRGKRGEDRAPRQTAREQVPHGLPPAP